MATPLPSDLLSGFETEGMKLCHCSLKFQPTWTYSAQIIHLPPQQVTVVHDGQPNRHVNFTGCKVIRLNSIDSYVAHGVMPFTLTVAGTCKYTKGDKKGMEIMMRTLEQSRAMNLPRNSEHDWCDYRGFEYCPVCWTRAKPGGKEKYRMVFQNLLQMTPGGVLAVKLHCRLICINCFEDLVKDTSIECTVGDDSTMRNVPVMEVINAQGPVTWLRDGQGLCVLTTPDHETLSAYQLYSIWDNCGAYKALEGVVFCQEFGSSATFLHYMERPKGPKTYWHESQIRSKVGKKCDGPGCEHVHGDKVKSGTDASKRIRLQDCTGCYEAMYCSKTCQHAAWNEHKILCREIQRKQKDEDEKKTAQDAMAREAARDAASASNAAASANPANPKSDDKNKKKGSKKGGNKKKEKK